jgi:hypothetical protein
MADKQFILLYGDIGTEPNLKSQNLIDGKMTCGYRDFAEKYGFIIYMTPQRVSEPWEFSVANPKNVVKFCEYYPDAIVWAIKVAPDRDKNILACLENTIIYYSCNGQNRTNKFAKWNLVDTEERVSTNSVLFVKGKDPEFWKPSIDKYYDYVLVGRRGDKNEEFFINELTKNVKEQRNILWIGGEKFKPKFQLSHHNIFFTGLIPPALVSSYLSHCRIGILYTTIKDEGFPQSFLEMTMCGVPVVYNTYAPHNEFYMGNGCINSNYWMCNKLANLIDTAELALTKSKNTNWSNVCRDWAVDHYSLQHMYERLCQYA